jgi:hypothetical protein
MTHIVTRPREEIIRVDFQGKTFEVRMGPDGAFVPEALAQYMMQRGLVGRGFDPDPKPRWEMHGNTHGDLIDKFARYVKEIPRSDVDEHATPEAVAAILLGRKPRKDLGNG